MKITRTVNNVVLWLFLAAWCILCAYCVPQPAQAHPSDPYRAAVIRESQFRFGIPPPAPVIAAQITQESGWNPLAKSPVGAQGLMQFMPATSAWANTAAGFGSVDPFNPNWSIRAGIWYDRWLYDRIKTSASECDRWHFVLSGYNGGLGYVYKRQGLSPSPGVWDKTGYINPGIHPSNQAENQSYGPRILLKHQIQYRNWGRSVCLP